MSRVQHAACKSLLMVLGLVLAVVGVFAIVQQNEGCTTLTVCEVQP